MNDIYKNVPGFGEPGASSKNSDVPKKAVSLRDRWESVRYGPVGRVLGYSLAFTVIFVLIFLFLWALEHYHF
ncbi:MAG TPA: hypothetical protein VK574_05970 [Terracidiphilus sp.]|nr:hypothetical protein [Terracidiphilus sp.]